MDGSRAPAGWTLWRVAKYVLIALGVLIALFFAAIGYAWWWMSGGVFTPDRFDAQTWSRRITKAEDSTCYRGGMGADIRDRILRPGMSRAEVERLLGEPDNSSNPNE